MDDLVAVYEVAAREHGQASEAGDYRRANRAHDAIAQAYRILRARGLEAQRRLLPLLDSDDAAVRAWVGAHALEFAPAEGERVLEELSAGPSSHARFAAEMTLQTWRKGELRFP